MEGLKAMNTVYEVHWVYECSIQFFTTKEEAENYRAILCLKNKSFSPESLVVLEHRVFTTAAEADEYEKQGV